MNERDIFNVARRMAAATERADYLAQACGGNSELRECVEGLLLAHDQAGSFLATECSAFSPAGEELQLAEAPGAMIGPYKLLQQIGEGGMGVVFMAEQTHPVQRRVALKVIKPGLDCRQTIARFEAERQALALMDHPHIAKVLDAGTTASGRPYFVMELVRGQPITQYCDNQGLTPRQRLELFVQVCQAIQHAHQKGLIHRDIKPSNILIAPYDGQPVVKVIDFGVAKATGQRLTAKTLFTQFGALVGTLEYMSPEQAELNNQDIDTRSDLYSLGVLLYELLTGTTPLDRVRLKDAAFDELLRIIREDEPPRPSTRLSKANSDLPAVSAQRRTEPEKIAKLVRGELDWIVMKALDKNRSRRYETANSLALDVQRYLDNEPVHACPPSAAYRFHKFVGRNRAAMTSAVFVLVALVLGTIVSVWQAVRATRAERDAIAAWTQESLQRQQVEANLNRAVQAEQRAQQSAQQARTEEERAKLEAETAQTVYNFFTDDLLSEASPDRNARGKQVTVEELLGRAADRIAGRFALQPHYEAAIQKSIGDTYFRLGNLSAARKHLERAVELLRQIRGREHPHTVETISNLATVYQEQAQFGRAEPLLTEVLEIRRHILGEEHVDTLNALNNLATLYQSQNRLDEAETMHAATLAARRRILGSEHSHTLNSLNNLATVYQAQGRFEKAEPLYRELLETQARVARQDDPETLGRKCNYALLLQSLGRVDEAVTLLVSTLDAMLGVLGEEHPATLVGMDSLAHLYVAQDRRTEAEPLLKKALELRLKVLGEEHPKTIKSLNNLATLYRDRKQYELAEPLYLRALEATGRAQLEEHPDTRVYLANLATMYMSQNLPTKAEPVYIKLLDLRRRALGDDHFLTAVAMNELGRLYSNQRQFEQAEPLLAGAVEILRRDPGEQDRNTLNCMTSLAVLYWKMKRLDRSIPLFEEALKIRLQTLETDDAVTLTNKADLGVNYRDAGRLDEAIRLLEEVHHKSAQVSSLLAYRSDLIITYLQANRRDDAVPLISEKIAADRAAKPAGSPQLAQALGTSGQYLLQAEAWAAAEPILRECLATREAQQADNWQTFAAKCQLGRCLIGQGKYADAEPFLLSGYEGLARHAAAMPTFNKDRVIDALEGLVQLYDAWGQVDRAQHWRNKLMANLNLAEEPEPIPKPCP